MALVVAVSDMVPGGGVCGWVFGGSWMPGPAAGGGVGSWVVGGSSMPGPGGAAAP